ncbi:MAG: hypothetical protein ACXVA9_06195 [Bdellovibrionales bacterium]
MRLFTILLFSLLTQEILARPLPDISPNQPLCFKASFTPEQMSAHPKQTASEIWMKLYMQKDPQDPTVYMNLQLTLRGEIFRTGMICDHKPNGSLHCAVECDGGQAELWPNGQSATDAILVNKGMYVNASCDPVDHPIFWEGSPGDDDVFDLQLTACE